MKTKLTRQDYANLAYDLGVMSIISIICICVFSRFTIGGFVACLVAQIAFTLALCEVQRRG